MDFVAKMLIDSDKIERWLRKLFCAAGQDLEAATITASALVLASMRGVDSHGIRLAPQYLREIEAGRVDCTSKMLWEQTSSTTGIFNANHGSAYLAGHKAMAKAIDMAENSGSGWVSVKNSNHCGMMAFYALQACQHDMIGVACTHATPRAVPTGGVRPFLGTNPVCFAAPMKSEEPFCYDAATTSITFNSVKQAREEGLLLPRDVAADESGAVTQDAAAAVALFPFGGYKGFGLMMLVDILSGLLSGMPVGADVSSMYGSDDHAPRKLGHFFGAIRVNAFEEASVFKNRLQLLCDTIRAEPRVNEDVPVMIPGDPEKKMFAARSQSGIPVSDALIDQLASWSNRYSIPPDEQGV